MATRQERQERHSVHATSLGIHLGRGDLAELWLRKTHAGSVQDRYSHGAMSFPRHRVLQDRTLNELINLLEDQGRIRVDVRLEKHGGGAASGNVVVYPQPDECVENAINIASAQALDPVLRLFSSGEIPMESVTVLPNTSSTGNGKAKGMVIETPRQADRWWRDLHGLDWALGRGMRVVSLGMNTDQFIDTSDTLLAETFSLSKTFPHGSLKYVWFLHDESGQMFMAVAGGPTKEEAKDNIQTLAKIPRRIQAQTFIDERREFYRDRRNRQVNALANVLGVAPQELATDAAYIDLDTERGLLVSGATDNVSNGMLPFTVGTAGIILHPGDVTDAVPIGTKLISQAKGFEPMLPPNIKEQHRLSQAPPALFAPEDITQHIATFSNPIQLQTLALGFHSDWR